jgi:1,2-dihydroxy-3-keto-5-methylthiopentene dioxygenase
MTTLAIQPDDRSAPPELLTDYEGIREVLAGVGVDLQRWEADVPLGQDATQEEILAAYADSIARLNARHGFRSVDVARIHPAHPAAAVARQKFLAEHTHDDHEIRFFVEGRGRFYLHIGPRVYMVDCEAGDLLSVPAGTRHWFDMGERPLFTAIRLFTSPDGWQASFTGSDIAQGFPELPT